MKVFVILLMFAYANGKPGLLAPATVLVTSSQYHSQDELGQYSYGYTNPQSSKAEVKTADGVTQGSYSYIDAEGKLQSVRYTSDEINGFRVAATNLPAPILAAASVPVVNTIEDNNAEVIVAKSKHPESDEANNKQSNDEKLSSAPLSSSIKSQLIAYHGASPFYYHQPIAHVAAPGFAYATTYGFPQFTYFKHLTPFAAATYAAPAYYAATTHHHHIAQIPAVPADTPEVAKARAEHLKAYEEVKARNL